MATSLSSPPKFQRKRQAVPSSNAQKVDADNAPTFPHVEEFVRTIKFDYYAFDDLPQKYSHLQHVTLRARREEFLSTLKPHKPLRLRWANEELPVRYSLRDKVTKVLNQGNLGACVAHSMAQALNILSQTSFLDAAIPPRRWGWNPFAWFRAPIATQLQYNGIGFDGSRLFIYDSARIEDGTSLDDDAGCSNFSACLGVAQWGVCEEKLWPYEQVKYRIKPPDNVYEAAKKHTNIKYSVVDRTFDAVCAAVASQHPVMIGVMVYSSLIHSGLDGGHGYIPLPHPGEQLMGGHSLLVVAYDREAKTVTCVNHWGEAWGDRGFCTLPAEYIENNELALDFVAIEYFTASS